MDFKKDCTLAESSEDVVNKISCIKSQNFKLGGSDIPPPPSPGYVCP